MQRWPSRVDGVDLRVDQCGGSAPVASTTGARRRRRVTTAVVLRPSRRRRGVTLCAAVCGFSDAGGRPRFQLLRAAREGLWLLLFALAGSDCARSHRCGAKQVRALKTKKTIKTGFPKIVNGYSQPVYVVVTLLRGPVPVLLLCFQILKFDRAYASRPGLRKRYLEREFQRGKTHF